jgi:hypothetical protein
VRDDGTIQICSFRVCFQLERRLHKIDRWRVPVPYGVPVRGICYAIAAVLFVVVLDNLPVTDTVIGTMPFAVRYAVLPVGGAYLFVQWRLDGRTAHAAVLAWVRYQLSPRRVCAFRPMREATRVTLGSVTVAHDERAAAGRRGEIRGPARVVLRYPATLKPRRRTLIVTQEPGAALWQGKQVVLRARQRMVVA